LLNSHKGGNATQFTHLSQEKRRSVALRVTNGVTEGNLRWENSEQVVVWGAKWWNFRT